MSSDHLPNPWEVRQPSPGETCVFTHGYFAPNDEGQIQRWKRDALLFDRVYAPCADPENPPNIPIQLTFGLASVEHSLRQYDASTAQMIAQAYGDTATAERMLSISLNRGGSLGHDLEVAREYANAGIMAEWSYTDAGAFLRRFSEGERISYEGALSNIPLIRTEAASWDQILEFRADPNAVRKYRDLRLWLRSGLSAQSAQHAADIIGQKIEDYRWSIRQHGFETTLGALKALFDWKDSKLALAAGGVAVAAGGPIWGALAGGLGIGFQIGAYLVERRLQKEEKARGANREVAILYDIQERFGTATGEGTVVRCP